LCVVIERGWYLMHVTFVAHATVVIHASRNAVWAALFRPETIERVLPVEVVTHWREGEAFLWMLDMAGKSYRVDGVAHRIESDRLVEYDFIDPHALAFEHIERRHRVRIDLTDEQDGTRISVAQDNNATNAILLHAEGGWRLALHNLKALLESESESESGTIGSSDDRLDLRSGVERRGHDE
jgi:uncharacterized protein YndB with AHSA1/START domain